MEIEVAFDLALQEAKRGLGFVEPNPPVGCVILDRDGNLLSVGFHHAFGQPHAEVDAIQKIDNKSKLNGAKIFVTLEPCSHFGKTPPCAELLAQYPLAEVYYGLKDPNPKVSGKGLEKLEKAGIKTIQAPEEIRQKLEVLMEIFLTNMRFSEPFIALKVAASLDGQLSLRDGESQWITSEKAREEGQRLRARYGFVLTGVKTLKMDDPRMNCRVEPFEQKEISLGVMDRLGECADFLKNSKAFKLRDPSKIFILTSKAGASRFDAGLGVKLLNIPESSNHLDLKIGMRALWEQGVHSLLVEGGPSLTSAFLKEGLFHRLHLFMGNKILGAGHQKSWTEGLSVNNLSQALSLADPEIQMFQESFLISGRNPNSFNTLLH